MVGLKKNNITYIVHDNLRGDLESITDYSGNIVAQAHYDPWGNRISSSGSLVQPFRYAGYYYDDETGLYYLKSRYYSPVLGRFLTRDGIKYIEHKDPQTLNLYSYAENDPVSHRDPDGHAIEWVQKGHAFAEQVLKKFPGFIKNTKDSVTSYGKRIPDFTNGKVIGEIKNVSYQYLSKQIKGFMEIADREGKKFVLVVNQGAKLSAPLIREINRVGGKIIEVGQGASKGLDMVPVVVPTQLLDDFLEQLNGQYAQT